MSCYDEQAMSYAISEFKYNLVSDIFNVLKKNYHNICTFKANQAIKIARDIIYNWRYYAVQRRIQRQKE